MAGNLAYLITGSNRGIGRQMVADLLLRPATTVVATVRDTSSNTSRSLDTLPTAAGSRLVVMQLEVAGEHIEYERLRRRLEAEVGQLDVVVANAATAQNQNIVLSTEAEVSRHCFEVNSIGPMRLFQACWPLLERSDSAGGGKKFVLVASIIGSIERQETIKYPSTAYGMSKAAANWLAKAISVEFREQELAVGVIHPGWVRTDMGQILADATGVKQPPTKVEDSVRGMLQQMDRLCLETSGQFINADGQKIPW